MFLAVALVELIGKPHNGIGSAGPNGILLTVQAGATQAGFAGKDVDPIAAELLLDTFTVEQYRLCCTGTEYSGEYDRWKFCNGHKSD